MSLVIGLTGGIGSGKTVVSDRLAKKGIEIIDADCIARKFVEKGSPALKKIAEHFSAEILLPNGELNRKRLRQVIFESPQEKTWLENLLHPPIRAIINEKITASKSPYCVLVAPLLLEGDLHSIVDNIVVVDCPVELQIKRASQRDDSNEKSIRAIIKQQMSREEKCQMADIVLDNSGSLESFSQQIDALHQQLISTI